jgi:membrane-associated phospholipid phosphatase
VRATLQTVLALVLAWVAICLVTLGYGWLVIHPLAGSVGAADDDAVRWFASWRTPTLDGVAHVGELIGLTPVGEAVIALLGAGFALWRRTWRPLVFSVVSYVGIGGFYFAATHLEERDRPPVEILDTGLVADHSFPSGHVGTATAIVGVLALLLLAHTRTRPAVLAPLALLPLFVLFSRLYQGAHHPTDVLAALLYTTAWLLVVGRVVLRDPVVQDPRRTA